jgi:hypothetical protein
MLRTADVITPAKRPRMKGMAVPSQVRQDDEKERGGVEPANSVLLGPGIALVAPRDGFAANQMPLNRLRLSDVACVFEQASVNAPAAPVGCGREIQFECRIRRPVIAMKKTDHRGRDGYARSRVNMLDGSITEPIKKP